MVHGSIERTRNFFPTPRVNPIDRQHKSTLLSAGQGAPQTSVLEADRAAAAAGLLHYTPHTLEHPSASIKT